MLPIVNKPHIEHMLDLLQRHGISDVVLLTSYLADAFTDVIGRASSRGVRVQVAHEEEPLGTAGAIKNAESLIGDETFFAFNGDVLTSADLTSVLAFHRERGAVGTLVLTPVEDPSVFGVVPTDPDGRVERFVEKPPPGTVDTNLINAGIYVLEPEVLGWIQADQVVSIEREVFPGIAESGRLFALSTGSYWMDIGTPEKYLRANLDALDGTFPSGAWVGPGDSVVAGSARLEDGARVSSACIGEGCVIGAGAVISGSVLLDQVVVSPGATVTGSVLGEGVRVEQGVSVAGVTAADGETIGGND